MRRNHRNNCISALLLLLALLLGACGGTAPGAETPPAATAQPETSAAPRPSAPPPTAAPKPAETEQPPAQTPEPEASALLSQREPVEDSFFEKAAFLGNSLVRGLELYGGLGAGDFYAVTSASVVTVDINREKTLHSGAKGSLLQALCEHSYDKVYILFGINEISFDTNYFTGLYGQLLDKLQEGEPEAEIYIMGLTPVTEKKSAEGELFSMERIAEYNAALLALAEARGCRYVDLTEALSDESGYLPEAQSTDGIHLTQDKYLEWADYLRTHYA